MGNFSKIYKIYILLIVAISLFEITYFLYPNYFSILISCSFILPFFAIGIGATLLFTVIIASFKKYYEIIGKLLAWAGFFITALMSIVYAILFWFTEIDFKGLPQIANVSIFPHPSILFVGFSLGFFLHLRRVKLNKFLFNK